MATSLCNPTTASLRLSSAASAARTFSRGTGGLHLCSSIRAFPPLPHPRSRGRAPPPDHRHGPLLTGRLTVRCGAVTTIGQNDFSVEVLGSDIPVLVEFVADWCGPCRLISPVIEWASQCFDDASTRCSKVGSDCVMDYTSQFTTHEEYNGKLKVVKIDHDVNPQLIEEYKVYGLPALILFKNGQEVPESRREGAITKVKLKEYLDSLLGSTTVV